MQSGRHSKELRFAPPFGFMPVSYRFHSWFHTKADFNDQVEASCLGLSFVVSYLVSDLLRTDHFGARFHTRFHTRFQTCFQQRSFWDSVSYRFHTGCLVGRFHTRFHTGFIRMKPEPGFIPPDFAPPYPSQDQMHLVR